jgi:hypothetical protein
VALPCGRGAAPTPKFITLAPKPGDFKPRQLSERRFPSWRAEVDNGGGQGAGSSAAFGGRRCVLAAKEAQLPAPSAPFASGSASPPAHGRCGWRTEPSHQPGATKDPPDVTEAGAGQASYRNGQSIRRRLEAVWGVDTPEEPASELLDKVWAVRPTGEGKGVQARLPRGASRRLGGGRLARRPRQACDARPA